MFRPCKVILMPSKKTSKSCLGFTALWDPKCLQVFVTECKVHRLVYIEQAYILYVL